MISSTVTKLRQLEIFGLYCLAFSLPIFETPKGIASILFFLGALGWRLAEKPMKWRKPDTFEWLLISMWIISLASTLANWPLPNGVSGLKDSSQFLLIGWLAYRNTYDDFHIKWLPFVLIGGVVLGLVWGLWAFISGNEVHLLLHSIPNLNRGTIYIGISITLMIGVSLDTLSNYHFKYRVIAGVLILFTLTCLFIAGSRGGVLGFFSAAVLIAITSFKNKKLWIATATGLALSVIIISILLTNFNLPMVSNTINKFIHYGKALTNRTSRDDIITDSDRVRFDYIRLVYAQFTQGGHPLLGVGPKTFSYLDMEKLKFNKPLSVHGIFWKKPSHAHNGFLNKLVEEGLFGLIAFIIFLAYITKKLIRHRPRDKDIHWSWIACLGVVAMTVVSGLFNTVITNEMGWLSMLIIGLGMKNLKDTRENI